MNRRSVISMMVAAGGYCATRNVWPAEKPRSPEELSIDGSGPKLGVYLGAGCDGAKRLPAFEQWLGRRVDQTIEFLAWNIFEQGGTWSLKCWKQANRQNVVFSIPMMPPKDVATLADGANGKFDDLFRNYAKLLIQYGFANSILRIGWEFNANWYAWRASKDPSAWAAYWHRIVTTIRETPGAAFKYDWCPTAFVGGMNAERVYPGDDVVDYIGLDFYNSDVAKGPQTPQQRWNARMNMKNGLKWHRDFARSHNKLASLPEWGTGVNKKWGGGGDDPYFIDSMADWISETGIAYHNYWDYVAKDFDAKLSNGSKPEAAAVFKRRFGGPGVSSSLPQAAGADA